MNKKIGVMLMFALAGAALVFGVSSPAPAASAAPAPAMIANTGTLSGVVTAPKSFKAAEVFLRGVDKHILYMVYTAEGHYRAVNVLPGNYEVTVVTNGLVAESKKVLIKTGANASADFSMREGQTPPRPQGGWGGPAAGKDPLKLETYEELYPAGPGRAQIQRTCMVCHGLSFLPGHQWDEAHWNGALDMMMNKEAGPSAQIPPGTFTDQDRAEVIAYLTKNFSPDKAKRALKVDAAYPVDEQTLSRAMYIEYYLPLDPVLDAKNTERRAQEPHFDSNGNVWYTDRSIPNRVGVVDPRTAEIKDYVLPDPKADPHGLTVDKGGDVWWTETRGFHLGRLNSKTGEMTRYDMDSTGGSLKGLRGHTPVLDSKQNVWFTIIVGSRLGKWDRQTGKISTWAFPSATAFPYGIVVDKGDQVWMAELRGCKIARFDPETEKFTEYPSPTQPCTIQRLGADSKGTIWYGVGSSGKLGKLDPKTGKIVEYNIPMPYSQPYDVNPDGNDNVWISDAGQGGTLIKFDPRTEKFTYYPSPQVSDMPRVQITREGAIWYCPRASSNAAVGVLYPDVSKMTTLAAYY